MSETFFNLSVGKHPQGIPSSSNLQEGRQSQHCCCLQSGSICPSESEFGGNEYDYGDEDYVGAIIPRAPEQNQDDITTRIVNSVSVYEYYEHTLRYRI